MFDSDRVFRWILVVGVAFALALILWPAIRGTIYVDFHGRAFSYPVSIPCEYDGIPCDFVSGNSYRCPACKRLNYYTP